MKISQVQLFEYTSSYLFGDYGMSHGRAARGHVSLVARVATDEGTVGWAETCPNGRTYLPSFAEGEREALRVLAPAVLGLDPRNLGALNDRMDQVLMGSNAAKGVLDMACWDMFGQAAGLPVCDLLGGRRQESFPLWVAVPVAPLEEMATYVERDLAQGIRVFQVKVGDDPVTDVARVRAVAEAAGPGATVLADANGGWNLTQALVAARQLEGTGVRLEQPCRTMADCAELRRHTSLPLVLDESVVTVDDLTHAKLVAGATGVNLKPGRIGGFTRLRALRDTAQGLGMTFTIDDTWGGALTTVQNAHLAASSDPELCTGATFFSDWIEPVIATGPRADADGRGQAPVGPGLGVRVHEDLLGNPVLSC